MILNAKCGIKICHIYNLLFLIIAILAFSGCATMQSGKASNIIETDLDSVQGCENRGIVQGHSGWGNLMASVGLAEAKNGAKEMAAMRNATHIVWLDIIADRRADVTGQAYRCSHVTK